MSQARNITISYELHPPADTPSTNLSASTSHQFPVSSNQLDLGEHYETLRGSLAQAKDVVGNELTEWKDVVGKLELSKEPKPPKKYAELYDEENDEEVEES
ncbi:hypothetical protein EUX98_g3568 [Antrodiella citrinella]|uniref:EKC/KEOPS complex subunit GON7 n=1 Tax=Antrodiella citrinella TaxID=2447956 RepID=A0A4S4MW85_9APHY|nr:hypothetical protein EUX98_g3568 [Antrodiella citrinella]